MNRFFLALIFTLLTFHVSPAQNKSENDNVTESFTNIKIVPLIPIYNEKKWSLEEKKKLTKKYILDKIQSNLNGINLRGTTRILVYFVITTEGDLKRILVHTQINELKEIILDNIESLPKFVPGMKNGEPVNVSFKAPIVITSY